MRKKKIKNSKKKQISLYQHFNSSKSNIDTERDFSKDEDTLFKSPKNRFKVVSSVFSFIVQKQKVQSVSLQTKNVDEKIFVSETKVDSSFEKAEETQRRTVGETMKKEPNDLLVTSVLKEEKVFEKSFGDNGGFVGDVNFIEKLIKSNIGRQGNFRIKDKNLECNEEKKDSQTNSNLLFTNLRGFLRFYYIEEIYEEELLNRLDESEMIILLKMINSKCYNIKDEAKADFDLKKIFLKSVKNFFEENSSNKKKKKRVISNKAFIFNQVKKIMMRKLVNKLGKTDIKKNDKFDLFYNYYFKDTKEFPLLNDKQIKDLQLFFDNYLETRVHLIWRFEGFVNDFSAVFRNLDIELKENYYKEKLLKFSNFFDSLKNKNLKQIKSGRFCKIRLPHTHNYVQECKEDFINSFGYFL